MGTDVPRLEPEPRSIGDDRFVQPTQFGEYFGEPDLGSGAVRSEGYGVFVLGRRGCELAIATERSGEPVVRSEVVLGDARGVVVQRNGVLPMSHLDRCGHCKRDDRQNDRQTRIGA